MARTALKPEVLRDIRELAAGWGQIVARRAFGEGGPGLDVDLSALEEVALEAARGLTEGTLAVLARQQAGALGQEQPCPGCGRPCSLDPGTREVHVSSGQAADLADPKGHCPACRRDFFPPAVGAAPGRPRV